MKELSYEDIQKEPDATVFAAIPPGGDEGPADQDVGCRRLGR